MKPSILKYFAVSYFCIASIAQAGVKEGGGGILESAEFATVGRSAIQLLGEGDDKMNLASILEQIKDIKVIPVDSICYTDPVLNKQYCEDGHFDKVNNVILFNSSKWDGFSCTEKLVLSSHEFLRASGYEAEDYSYSGRFLNGQIVSFNLPSNSPEALDKHNEKVVLIENRLRELCRQMRNSKVRPNP